MKKLLYTGIGLVALFLITVFSVNLYRSNQAEEILVKISQDMQGATASEREQLINQTIEALKGKRAIKYDLLGAAYLAQYDHDHNPGGYCNEVYKEIGWGIDAYYATGDSYYIQVALHAVDEYLAGCYNYA